MASSDYCVKHCPSLREEVTLALALNLLCLDLWRNDGMMYDMRSVHSINWRHPEIESQSIDLFRS